MRKLFFDCRAGIGNQFCCQVRVGCHNHKGGPKKGVGPGRENGDRGRATLNHKVDFSPLGAANPVALHGQDFGRPATLQLVEVIEEPVSIISDFEIPLGQFFLNHHGPAAIRGAIRQYLLVGKHGLVDGVPVHPRILAIGQTLVVQGQKQPLVPVVILRVRGVENATPVKGSRVTLHRRFLLLDVGIGPLFGIHAALNRGIFGGKPEGIPADGVENLKTL